MKNINKFMYDLRDKNKPQKINIIKFLKWKYFIFLIIILIILFPLPIATFIGNWISDFFGTIINIITNG